MFIGRVLKTATHFEEALEALEAIYKAKEFAGEIYHTGGAKIENELDKALEHMNKIKELYNEANQ